MILVDLDLETRFARIIVLLSIIFSVIAMLLAKFRWTQDDAANRSDSDKNANHRLPIERLRLTKAHRG